jgi:hypothetical protein
MNSKVQIYRWQTQIEFKETVEWNKEDDVGYGGIQ